MVAFVLIKHMKHEKIVTQLFNLVPTKGNLKRVEIIEAAIECLVTIGIDKTTFEAIASKIGTRKAHVAYYFPNKDDIFIEVVKYISTVSLDVTEQLLKTVKKDDDPFEVYVKSAFIWGEKYPKQAMLLPLFYYLCTFKKEYQLLNDQIQENNEKQIRILLSSKIGMGPNSERIKNMARTIQHTIIGELINAATTSHGSYQDAKERALRALRFVLG